MLRKQVGHWSDCRNWISIDEVTRRLEDEGFEKCNQQFDKLVEFLA